MATSPRQTAAVLRPRLPVCHPWLPGPARSFVEAKRFPVVVDSDPDKVGTFVPGMGHTPVAEPTLDDVLEAEGVTDFSVYAIFVVVNLGLMLFNLVPIPPLDGSTLLFRLLPYEMAYRLRPLLAQYGILVLLGIVFFGGAVIGGILFTIVGFLLG